MKLEVSKIKDACDTLISEYRNRQAHESEAFEAYTKHLEDEWREKHQADWKKLATLINKKLRAGEVITKLDVAFLGAIFNPPMKGRSFEWEGVPYNYDRELKFIDAVKELRVFLDACATDTVTLAELKQTRYPQDFIGDILARAKGIDLGEDKQELTY
jgi:hypothetical protein